MEVIPPLAITNAMITAHSAPEPGVGEAAYVAATAYAIGDQVILGAPSLAVTITNASPGVVTWAANGLPNGTPVILTTSGTLPAGLSPNVIYYVVRRATGTFQLASVVDGTPIVTTSAGSGTHTATAHIHRKYESLIGSNTGNGPAIDDGTKWLDIGPTNRWALFDLLRNTETTFPASPGTVTITPGQRVDAIALVGLVAESVTITVTVSGSPVYTYTEDLSSRALVDWYDYFFEPFTYKAAVALFDLPPYVNGVVAISLTRTAGLPSCGGFILGSSVYLGDTLCDPESNALNFSEVTRDDFGNATMVVRRSIPTTKQQTRCKQTDVPKIAAARTALNAVPALWSGLDDSDNGYFEALLILGFYRSFTINMDQPNDALVSLELEEV